MQKRVAVVGAVAAVLGLAAAASGFAAEAFGHKALVGSDGFRCVYRRTPALACGILAALLSLAGLALVTAASGCFGCRYHGTAAPVPGTWRAFSIKFCSAMACFLVPAAAVMFLYGASRNVGGTGGLSPRRSRGWRYGGGGRTYDYDFVCTGQLKRGFFETASIAAAVGIASAVAAYVELQRRGEPHAHGQGGGVAMGQPQWSQPYPYPPPGGGAYPAPPPYGGYGAKQPAEGTA